MKVITTGGAEIGTLELTEEGHRVLAQAAYMGFPLRISFDYKRVRLQSHDTGEVTKDELELTLAAITPAVMVGPAPLSGAIALTARELSERAVARPVGQEVLPGNTNQGG